MGVHWAKSAVEKLNVNADILDLRTLIPLDEEAIFNSVKKQAEVYQKLMDLLQEKSKNGLVTVNFWSMGERISSRGKKGHYMSIYDNDTIPTKTYEVVKKFINFD